VQRTVAMFVEEPEVTLENLACVEFVLEKWRIREFCLV